MKYKSIRWRLPLSYASIALLAAILLGLIMMGILTRYYAIQESKYLVDTANELGLKYFSIEDLDRRMELEESVKINDILIRFSFYINAQIRLLDADGNLIADSGLPQKEMAVELWEETDKKTGRYPEDFSIARKGDRLFSGWLFSIQPEEVDATAPEEWEPETRSQQVVTQGFYNEDQVLLGYVELSNGPTFGRDIMGSITWGWAIAALAAVVLSGAVGLWVSRRFTEPLESLTGITSQMAGGDLQARSDIDREDEFGLLANSFNTMAERVESKVAALRRFVADAAHELGTPLTALRTNLELIEDEGVPAALEQVQRMDDLTRSLLDLSSLEALDGEINLVEVDLKVVLSGIAESYASRAEQAGLGFSLKMEDTTENILGDAAQLSVLIGNLLDNAVKFTPEGGRVQVQLKQSTASVILSVTDTGIGIPEDEINQMFSRFRRGSNTSAYPGNGLGLAIAKVIADRHQAVIEVERLARGTILQVIFPLHIV